VAAPDYQLVPWPAINKGKARDLAIAYCFMPYSDTSGVVAAKAISERRRVVDVISNDMGKVRRIDQSLTALSGPWMDEHVVIPTPASFAGWKPISDFATKALAAAERLDALKGPYETLYSRALWMGSHVAAALFKLRHWHVDWTAEFSDPLRRGADGNPRTGALVDNKVSRRLQESLVARGFSGLPIETSFDLVEAATLVLADSVMFTNDTQMSYMLSLYPDHRLRSLVEAKAVVRPHPTPDAVLYDASPTSYQVAPHLVNIAYFGSFYPNRGIGEVLRAIRELPEDVRRLCRIHIFCNDPAGVKQQVSDLGVSANVYVNPYLGYLEFLNASKLFDVLLVNDVTRGEMLPVNPFLPSKYSDYRGAGRSIWALVDPGSPLDRAEDVAYRTPLGEPEELAAGLARVVETERARKSSRTRHNRTDTVSTSEGQGP
jgi:glycosyltransferase involved in cell wall biosynthesis